MSTLNLQALWAQLQEAPTASAAWLQLSQHYGAAGLRPQQAYAAQQWRRLSPNPSAALPPSAEAAPHTPHSSAAGDHQGAIGALASSNPAFLRLLAQRVYQHHYWQEAIAVLERALARLHWEVYHLSAAEALCRQILALDPANGEARYLLNALPGRRGDAAAHLAAVEAHYSELGDPSSRLASSIAMASLYVDALSPEQIAQRHRQLCAPIEQGITPTPDWEEAWGTHEHAVTPTGGSPSSAEKSESKSPLWRPCWRCSPSLPATAASIQVCRCPSRVRV